MDQNNRLTESELADASRIIGKLEVAYSKKVVGQQELCLAMQVALIAGGHVLLESLPGLAKTLAAKTIAEASNGTFSRIQCTPDLLPSDIIGTQIYNYNSGNFETKIGPVHANFVLLDEINRSSAKTQSAMLEAMQERQVSVGGVVNYPSRDEEMQILNYSLAGFTTTALSDTERLTTDAIKQLQAYAKRVVVDDSIKNYIVNIVTATRNPRAVIDSNLARYVEYGVSPRGSIALLQVAQALALIDGRAYVTPDDVKRLRHAALRHRIILNFEAAADDVHTEAIIDAIFNRIQTP